MQRKITILGAAAALVAVVGTYACMPGQPGDQPKSKAQAQSLPWGQSPDMVAWETFAQIMAPAGNPGNTKVEFETWASDQDIYGPNPHWPALDEPKKLQPSMLGAAGRLQHGSTIQVVDPSECVVNYNQAAADAVRFPTGACIGEEVRRNWASYQYIVSNGLNTQAGLAAAFSKEDFVVSLPADSIEFKANWVKVPDLIQWLQNNNVPNRPTNPAEVAQLYYVNEGYALVSFHYFTKQIKNWVWTDFEHELNPGRCDFTGCNDSYGAVVANVPANSDLNQQYGQCAKSENVQAMFTNAGLSPVWNHYCLKGTQIDYTNPELLGNSVIEAVNAGVPILKSSCIGCHYYASFDQTGAPNINALVTNPVGPPNPALMNGYRSNDFIWGLVAIPSPPTKPKP